MTTWDAFPAAPSEWDAFPAAHPVVGPSGNAITDADRFVGAAINNAMAGALSTPRMLAQGVDWLGNKAGLDVGADRALAGIKTPGGDQPLFPDFQTAHEMALNTTGDVNYQPQSWLGRRALDATTGALLGAAGGGAAIPAAAGGSATAGAAAEVFPNHPFIASALGFIPGAMGANAVANAPARLASALKNEAQSEPYAAFVRQGLPTNMAGTVTGSPGLQWAEKWAARMPGSEGAMAKAREGLLSTWQDRLRSIADNLGAAETPTEAGAALQKGAQDWLTNFKTDTGRLWRDFYARVPQDTPVAISNYQQALTDALSSFPGASKTGDVLRPGTVKALSDALGVDLKGGDTLPWEAVKNIRTAIGEKLENPTTVADTSQSVLRRLYGGLTADMKAGAQSVGNDALAAFEKANGATATGHAVLEGYLDPILKADSPEKAAQYALAQARLGGDRLQGIASALPGAAGEIGSFALRNAATNTESPTSLATALAGRKPIYSREAQAVLFPGQAATDLADMVATGRAMQPLERDLANSVTATHDARGLSRLFAAKEMAEAGHDIAGKPGAVAGALTGFFAPNLSGRTAQLFALNPALARLYGNAPPPWARDPNLVARLLMNATVPQIDMPQAVLAPATSANSVPR